MKDLGNTLDELIKESPSSDLIQMTFKFFEENSEDENDTIEDIFGGRFYLVETEDDLKEIKTAKYNKDTNDYYNILEIASEFDTAKTLDPKFVMFFLATNNGGGNSYLVPYDMVKKYPTIYESLVRSNVAIP